MSIWTTQALPGNNIRPAPEDLEKSVVLLLYGKNSFGDKIYSYLKITIGGLETLKDAIVKGKGFNPSDFGSVIAAGKGEPSSEVRAEIATAYQVLDANGKQAATGAASAPAEKKAWDEY